MARNRNPALEDPRAIPLTEEIAIQQSVIWHLRAVGLLDLPEEETRKRIMSCLVNKRRKIYAETCTHTHKDGVWAVSPNVITEHTAMGDMHYTECRYCGKRFKTFNIVNKKLWPKSI